MSPDMEEEDDFDTPVNRTGSEAASPPVRMGRRASVVVGTDGAKTIVPTDPSRKMKPSFGVPSFGKAVAKARSRDFVEAAAAGPRGLSTAEPVGAGATARPEIGAATTREEVEQAFSSALELSLIHI